MIRVGTRSALKPPKNKRFQKGVSEIQMEDRAERLLIGKPCSVTPSKSK